MLVLLGARSVLHGFVLQITRHVSEACWLDGAGASLCPARNGIG